MAKAGRSRARRATTGGAPPPSGVDTLVVGWIRRPHGVRGQLEVIPSSDVAGRFAAGSRLELRTREGERRAATIVESRPHGTYLLVRLGEVADREEAESLRGASLEVSVDEVPSAPPGTFYYHELIGCRCRDRRRGPLGTVVDVREDGGGLLLEIEGEDHRLLIPFVKAYLPVIDPTGQLIETDLPPGLVEACGS